MTLAGALRGFLITVVVIALICGAVIAGAPIVARKLTLHYLAQAGVDAEIGNVDINLFAGTIAYHDIHGMAEAGDGFEISHLAIDIDYPPLLSKQIVLTRLAIANAEIDVRRTADNALRVGGITALSADRDSGGSMNWGLALRQLAVGGLTIHYSQPTMADAPAIDRTFVFNDSSARDVVTWDQDNDVPIDANLSVGDSQIRLTGRVTPFGKKLTAHFQVQTDKFALDLLTPIAYRGGLKSLTGTIDADQQIDVEYAPDSGLELSIQGQATWLDARLAMASGRQFSSSRLHWDGRFDMRLLQDDGDSDTAPKTSSPSAQAKDTPSADSAASTETAVGRELRMEGPLPLVPLFELAGTRALVPIDKRRGAPSDDAVQLDGPGFVMNARITIDDLDVGRPGGLTLRQTHGEWDGTSSMSLGGPTTTVETHSQLDTTGTALIAANGTTVTTDSLSWQGSTSTDIAKTLVIKGDGTLALGALDIEVPGGVDSQMADLDFDGRTRVNAGDGTVHIHTDGNITSQALHTIVPDTLRLNADRLEFQGTTDTDVGSQSTDVDTDGSLTAQAFVFDISQTATFEASDIDWQGDTEVVMGTLFSRQANGHLVAGDARLELAGIDIALTADRAVYDGHYGQTPDTAGDALVMDMEGTVDGHHFDVMNTAIDSPWVSLRQVHGDDLSIDGLEAIGVDRIKASGVGLLGDSRSHIAVVEAITAGAQNFRLRDLLHYRVETLDLEGANIHIRRNADGMGVISKFFGGGKGSSTENASTGSSGPSASYAFDTLGISGSALMFTDTAVEPTVEINGADLNLTVEDLDTAAPERDARYQLGLDVGSYGRLDSRGTIAPLATGGMNMNIKAWLRSLALAPLSGYLNAAMSRRIASGVADGTLDLAARDGQLDGNLDTTLSNFHLIDGPGVTTDILLGISMDTALDMVRRDNGIIRFETAILGDVTNPYFSIRNLVREAVLAGLRTTVLSDYSPVGLLNKAKNALLNIGRSVASRPVEFPAGRHYVAPKDRGYLASIAQALRKKPGLTLTIQGHATPADAKAMAGFDATARSNADSLPALARQRSLSVRDYLAARDVDPDRLMLAEPVVDRGADARPETTFTLTGR